MQEEIAWQISEALRLKLTGAQKKKLRKRPTVNPAAYQAYLRGRHHWNNWTPDGFRRALEHFERGDRSAIRSTRRPTPGSATPTARWPTTASSTAGRGFPRAQAAAERALELDAELADAHVTLALGQLFAAWDWPAAERELQQALALEPASCGGARGLRAVPDHLRPATTKSLTEARIARDLDPISLFINIGVAWSHHFAGRYRRRDPRSAADREIWRRASKKRATS